MSRRKKPKKRNWKVTGIKNRHHDKARSEGGKGDEKNIFVWDKAYHEAYHFLFQNRTLLEASRWLEYIHECNQEGIKINIGYYDEESMENETATRFYEDATHI